jgi:hypothetical protein
MSLAYYIVLKPKIEGFDPFVNGKAIAHADEKTVAKLCASLNVRPLTEFISADPDELAEFLEDEGVDPPEVLEEEQWFSAEEGLTTVRALRQHLAENPTALKNSAAIIDDLTDYEVVLEVVKQENVRWHLAVDF